MTQNCTFSSFRAQQKLPIYSILFNVKITVAQPKGPAPPHFSSAEKSFSLVAVCSVYQCVITCSCWRHWVSSPWLFWALCIQVLCLLSSGYLLSNTLTWLISTDSLLYQIWPSSSVKRQYISHSSLIETMTMAVLLPSALLISVGTYCINISQKKNVNNWSCGTSAGL